ncbi:Armadillo-type fold [Phytophthora cactorum]|nr:Armadillo-type fold [Phytophthora cactorum]
MRVGVVHDCLAYFFCSIHEQMHDEWTIERLLLMVVGPGLGQRSRPCFASQRHECACFDADLASGIASYRPSFFVVTLPGPNLPFRQLMNTPSQSYLALHQTRTLHPQQVHWFCNVTKLTNFNCYTSTVTGQAPPRRRSTTHSMGASQSLDAFFGSPNIPSNSEQADVYQYLRRVERTLWITSPFWDEGDVEAAETRIQIPPNSRQTSRPIQENESVAKIFVAVRGMDKAMALLDSQDQQATHLALEVIFALCAGSCTCCKSRDITYKTLAVLMDLVHSSDAAIAKTAVTCIGLSLPNTENLAELLRLGCIDTFLRLMTPTNSNADAILFQVDAPQSLMRLVALSLSSSGPARDEKVARLAIFALATVTNEALVSPSGTLSSGALEPRGISTIASCEGMQGSDFLPHVYVRAIKRPGPGSTYALKLLAALSTARHVKEHMCEAESVARMLQYLRGASADFLPSLLVLFLECCSCDEDCSLAFCKLMETTPDALQILESSTRESIRFGTVTRRSCGAFSTAPRAYELVNFLCGPGIEYCYTTRS